MTDYERGEQFVSPDMRPKIGLQVIEAIKQIDTASLDLRQFCEEVANLVQDRFGLYFVGLYLDYIPSIVLKEERGYARIVGGSGESGRQLTMSDHLILILPERSDLPVGEAIRLNKAQLVNDILEACYPLNPYLPDARTEIDIPLRTKQIVVGVLQICSCVPNSLSDQDIAVFEPMADQIAPIFVDLLKIGPPPGFNYFGGQELWFKRFDNIE